MEKKKSVGVTAFMITVLFVCLFIAHNSDLYSQTPPFGYVVEGNPEFRAKLENEIKNILESRELNVHSVTLSTKEEERLDKTVIVNINIVLLEKDADKTAQYLTDIKEVISKEIPDIDIYKISFTFETLFSPAPK